MSMTIAKSQMDIARVGQRRSNILFNILYGRKLLSTLHTRNGDMDIHYVSH